MKSAFGCRLFYFMMKIFKIFLGFLALRIASTVATFQIVTCVACSCQTLSKALIQLFSLDVRHTLKQHLQQ